MTRTHNDANILCLGARVISAEQAVNLTDIFLDTPAADSERHIRRIKLIEDIEKGIL
jgi:ribose 5-phosphate isomerase B